MLTRCGEWTTGATGLAAEQNSVQMGFTAMNAKLDGADVYKPARCPLRC
jgi:hypothetical protein